MKKLAVVLISLATAFTGIVPAHAFPSISAPKVEASQVQEVDHRRGHRWRGHRHWRGHNRHYGHRHYRRHRNSNAGAIIGGLAAGAIIGGALSAQQPRYSGGGNAHVRWCYDRYRSYRASDNTFQPYNGPRRSCRSPYY
ncbi:MAG TPA: BA14K family protein [Pseudorhizobium sp.]|nr:BA14K family protein [Pseudorhizobium sp.]